jgi:hypothetical protein
MTDKKPETLEETQRRLALGGVTTTPMLQTLDTAPRKRRSTATVVTLFVVAIAVLAVVAFVGALVGAAGS